MDHSTMDLTSMCGSIEQSRRRESTELVLQENHELKKKIEVLERTALDFESELNFLNTEKLKESAKRQDLQNDLNNANFKISKLESELEEEKLHLQNFMTKSEEIEKKPCVSSTLTADIEQLNILTEQILKLEAEREENQESIKLLVEEKTVQDQIIYQMKAEKQNLQVEMKELKEILEQRKEEIKNLNVNVDSIREEKFILSAELQILKSSDSNAARGNSLFAEVEENRQKVAAQRELLKIKYLNLKKVLSQKQVENNKLKLEVIRIRREETEDEKTVRQEYSDLVETYKRRLEEVEEEMRKIKQEVEKKPFVISGSNDSQMQWVDTVVETAKKEAQRLQAELERRGSYYVIQGHKLFDAQKENRKLKATIAKMQSEIDELKLNIETMKTAGENLDDGISPPAMDVAVEYQKQKIVRFKEIINSSKSPECEGNKENLSSNE